ncbi:MAG: potassium channel family protein [Bacteroidota bacterium]|nr:potassium channel family protein [Bacteroidota bacterium]
MVVWFYLSLAFYAFEKDVNKNVHEYFDAIWWAFTTVTSVGYGDICPVTKVGRIITMILVLSGMGLFSLVTAELSANFITIIKKEHAQKRS